MKYRGLLLIATLAAAVAAAAVRSLIFVDETETVIVTQFGRPICTLNAAGDEAGLHFKPPYQSTIRIDRRLQIYDPPPSEFLASEPSQSASGEITDGATEIGMNVNLDVFVCWRVDDPQQFLKTVNSFIGAEFRIHDIVWSELAAEVGRNPLEALVSVDPAVHRLDDLVRSVAEKCARRAKKAAYGIQIVDVQLKRISLPAQARENVFNRMRTERTRMAKRYRAEGEEVAQKIRAAADKQEKITLAKADAEAKIIRGDAEAKAIEVYAKAHKLDPEFYELTRTLEAYKKFLDEKTTILLSADSELLKYLTQGSMLPQQPESNSLRVSGNSAQLK